MGMQSDVPAERPSVDAGAAYAAKLLSIETAANKFFMSRSTFHRFRIRHAIVTLPGGRIHEDDIIAGIERERKLR
jgi:hypothetical protein